MVRQKFKIVPELTVRSRKFASKLDMIMGIDPMTGHSYTTDVEEALRDLQNVLKWARKDDHKQIFEMAEYQAWLNYFPEIREGILDSKEDAEYLLLKSMLSNVAIEGIHYIFHPESLWGDECRKNEEALLKDISDKYENVRQIDPALRIAFPLTHTIGPGKLIEEEFGFSSKIRKGLIIHDQSPALIANHLVQSDGSIVDDLSPRQLEELCYTIFKEVGWDVELTHKSNDGGKDVVARKDENGKQYLVYVEATTAKKVKKQKVQAFAAVLGSDNADKGYFVSSTYFSSGIKEWCAKSRSNVADVRLVDREKLLKIMNKITSGNSLVQTCKI
jgi:hypothetical protein